jgi:hypothetical protein
MLLIKAHAKFLLAAFNTSAHHQSIPWFKHMKSRRHTGQCHGAAKDGHNDDPSLPPQRTARPTRCGSCSISICIAMFIFMFIASPSTRLDGVPLNVCRAFGGKVVLEKRLQLLRDADLPATVREGVVRSDGVVTCTEIQPTEHGGERMAAQRAGRECVKGVVQGACQARPAQDVPNKSITNRRK